MDDIVSLSKEFHVSYQWPEYLSTPNIYTVYVYDFKGRMGSPLLCFLFFTETQGTNAEQHHLTLVPMLMGTAVRTSRAHHGDQQADG